MDQEVNSSILEKVDVFFTLMLRALLKWSWAVCLFLIGAAALYFQFILIFGNDAGLADVSAVEFLFFVIIAGLIWRHWKYAKKNSQSIFITMAKTLIIAGIVNVFLLALSAVVFYVVYAEGESLDKLMRTFFTADYLTDLSSMAFWILIFYFSAPVEKNISLESAGLESTDLETGDSELVDAGFENSELNSSELNSSELNSSEIVQVKSDEHKGTEIEQGNENEVKV